MVLLTSDLLLKSIAQAEVEIMIPAQLFQQPLHGLLGCEI
jgi:hypothetical protein